MLKQRINADRVNISRHSPWGLDAYGSERVLAGLCFIFGSYYKCAYNTRISATMVFNYNEGARNKCLNFRPFLPFHGTTLVERFYFNLLQNSNLGIWRQRDDSITLYMIGAMLSLALKRSEEENEGGN